MIDNRKLLARLIEEKRVRVQPAAVLEVAPPPLPRPFDFDRVAGMLLGLAIGDGLGRGSEGQTPAGRRERHGEIHHYLRQHYAGGRAVGLASDDTQLAFWTLEQLLEDDGLVPERLARRFAGSRIFGIGSAVRAFLHAFRDEGLPWEEAGQPSAGNGALMRIAPVLLPHLRQPSAALWADAILATMVTHNDEAACASSAAFVRVLWELLGRESVPPAGWWVETFCSFAVPLEGEAHYSPRTSRLSWDGPVSAFAREMVTNALARGWTTLEACEHWYSGAYLLETVPSVLYILERHAADPEQAIVRAINDTRDNDTVAAIVGAAVGALHGRRALPERWQRDLLGRTREADDGHVQELIAEAEERFG